MGHRPFLVLADHLTRQGIAVLRYDDRGIGKSTGNFAEATHADFVEDTLAAVDWLKSRKDIDPAADRSGGPQRRRRRGAARGGQAAGRHRVHRAAGGRRGADGGTAHPPGQRHWPCAWAKAKTRLEKVATASANCMAAVENRLTDTAAAEKLVREAIKATICREYTPEQRQAMGMTRRCNRRSVQARRNAVVSAACRLRSASHLCGR